MRFFAKKFVNGSFVIYGTELLNFKIGSPTIKSYAIQINFGII